MDSETSEFVLGTGARQKRRFRQLHLRAGGLGYGIAAYGYPGGAITGVQGSGGTNPPDDMPTMGPQFPEGGGPVSNDGGSGGDMGGGGDGGGGGL